MANDRGMFCKRCYANLDQARDGRCLRCGRRFVENDLSSYLERPFPSRVRMFVHTLITLVLATVVSAVVAGFLALAQLKFVHSGH
jgi:hypothetical protein